jgi:hypothetical protein
MHGDEDPTSDSVARSSRHKVRWTQAIAALLVVMAAVGLLVWKPWETKPQAKQPSENLVLTGVTAAVSPRSGGCGTTFHFTGKVAVARGAGALTFEWMKPDGATTDRTTAIERLGSRYQPSLEYSLRGPGHLSGDAVLVVSKPVQLRSAPVHIDYAC